MDANAMIEAQYVLGQKIEQFVSNCKKAGKPRRTLQFLTNKIAELQQLGDQFHQQHENLQQQADKDLNDTYFNSNYYEQILSILTQYSKSLEAEALQLTRNLATKDAGLPDPPMSQPIRKLLRNQRALIEVIRNNVNNIMAQRNVTHPPSYYSVKAAILEKHMIDLARNNSELWDSTEDDCIEDYTPETYYALESEVEAVMIELQQHINESMAPPTGVNSRSTHESSNGHIPLPRISLPKFNGDYMQWASFKDLFIELVNNASTTDTQRIYYLNNALTDEPRNLIKHLPAIGSNYAAAWEILITRYDNQRLMVSTLLNSLFSQPTIKPDSANCIKSLHDVTKECIHGLKGQGLPVQHWDALIAHILLRKMDQATQTAFEQSLDNNRRLITQEETLAFLEKRFQSLEVRNTREKASKRTCGTAVNSNEKCIVCKQGNHQMYACSKFKASALQEKWQYVRMLKLCANCLRPGHLASACKSQHCTKCSKKHNTLLHPEQPTQTTQNFASSLPIATTEGNEENSNTATSLILNNNNGTNNVVLLGTARIKLQAANGRQVECRAVLDSGSQVNLITERLQRKLGVSSSNAALCIEGVGKKETSIRHRTTITLMSRLNNFTAELDAHVIPKIVSDQPTCSFNTGQWNIPHDVVLADPHFASPGQIDCLLGAGIFFELLTNGKLSLGANHPTLINTVLGWVVSGNIEVPKQASAVCGICTSADLDKVIATFWKNEEVPTNSSTMTEDELRCETHFLQNMKRAQDGRFIVRLPLKTHPSVVVDSRGIAYERFKAIERRLDASPTLKEQYVNFMREYQELGHMTPICAANIASPCYFIPHHCVLRPESTSTKLRVVFDASATKVSKPSLNDIMYTGPTVQSELFSILLRFRMHRYALTTDVEKMYRQIWIHDNDRNLQLIMWRESASEPIQFFKLNTVTYGTRAAPYLATRCLKELATINRDRYPFGAQSLKNDFYVDDGLIGADTIHEALDTQKQLITMLGEAGMKLRKWCANDARLLNGIPLEDKEVDLNFNSEEDISTKTLGLLWLPKKDVFCVKANVQNHTTVTKRTMTSDLAHIYDPLGLIAPVLVTGKIQIQRVWQIKLDWDEALPTEIAQIWTTYRDDLAKLNNSTFPRYCLSNEQHKTFQLHAFADACEKAFGAAIYIRSVLADKSVKINLLCAKSRVAPTTAQTIPKLELCAALLAAELMARVKMDLNCQNKAAFFWTDSQIVLSWIQNHPGKLQHYVANRIIKIRALSEAHQWHYVPSKQNPADILSRGLKPSELSTCTMWFYGPMFLYKTEPVPNKFIAPPNNQISSLTAHAYPDETVWIYNIPSKNSFRFVQRVVGYILRFTKNMRKPTQSRPNYVQLSAMELDESLKLIVQQIQASELSELKRALIKENFVPKAHQYSSLTPFLDEEGIIRVGGRLSSSNEQYDAIHQMILPGCDPLVKLLIEKLHKENYHCGPQALLAIIRQRFWPLNGKGLARAVVQHCVKCTRAKPTLFKQIMGNLPASRVVPARPFLNSGVDYCGPFWVHFKTKGKRPQKAYLAVFCCFVTKAVHLELVTDLTTDAFIGALKRFIGRRGHCKNLFCDNATNFVGARNELKELDDIIYSSSSKEAIIRACSTKGIEFHFIPPRSPHFGGLWEAAVKSAKHLMIKNISSASLTYEELETVIIEIEAILNSRPLTPISSNPNDFNAITPGHILIGEPLLANVDVHAQNPTGNLVHRWQRVSELKHNFWKRWSTEYLSELQERHKWKGPISNIQPNTMVIIKEDNMPVLQWPLGRIITVHKGNDGLVRVCDVKTKKGIFTRAVHRLAPLFPEQDDNSGSATNSAESETSTIQQPMSLIVSIPLSRIRKHDSIISSATQRKVPKLNTSLMLTIITLLLIPMALCKPINITSFNNTPGVYFEQLRSIKQVTANWKLVVYFELAPYKEQVHLLNDGISTLQKLCDNSSNNTSCTFLLNHFDKTTTELNEEFNILSVKRSKRGALDVVGNIANSLFGVLDSNYATTMSQTINQLKHDDKTLEKLLQDQTSVIDSTINIMKKHQQSTKAKFDEIDSRIDALLFGQVPFNEIVVEQNILNLSVQMLILESSLQHIQSSIMDMIIDGHHGKISPLLLTPEQLHEEIVKIKAHLPPQYQFPIHQNNIIEVYKLIKIKASVAKEHIVFSVELPLTDPREFQLLHLLPIVAKINNTLVAINLSTRFLAISPHHDEFLPMQQSDLDNCEPFNDNELLCSNIQSIFHVQSKDNTCEIELFNNEANPRCDLYPLKETVNWYQLKHPNKWIFVTLHPIKLNAVCGEQTLQVNLNASGLLQLEPDCTIKNNVITIHSQRTFTTSVHVASHTFSTKFGWTKQYSSSNISIKAFSTNMPALEEIQNQLAHIKTSHLETSTSTTATHSLIISYIAISIMLAAIVVIAIRLHNLKKTTKKPIPQPRFTRTNEETPC